MGFLLKWAAFCPALVLAGGFGGVEVMVLLGAEKTASRVWLFMSHVTRNLLVDK